MNSTFLRPWVVALSLSISTLAATAALPPIDYGQLPIAFEENTGQFDDAAKFFARGQGYRLFLTPTEAVVEVRGQAVRLKLVGANPQARVTGQHPLEGKANYFIGNDPQQWRTGVPLYGQVRYERVYPGVDLVHYGKQGELEHDFIVAPGTNPRVIRLGLTGITASRLVRNGDLVLTVPGGELRLEKPVIYQETAAGRQPVEGRYVWRGRNQVGFQVARYDRTRPLVIDPVLVYATFLKPPVSPGGDHGLAITVNAAGNAYVAGVTESATFPTTGGAFDTTQSGGKDAFVAKLNPAGTALVFATYLGGSGNEIQNGQSCGIAIDKDFNVYVVGATSSTNFPATAGAYQETLVGADDAFVAKLNPTGSALLYATYLGGTGSDYAWAVAVDTNGNAYACGETANTDDFPTTPGAFLTSSVGLSGWVTKLNSNGTALVYSTYLSTNDSSFAHGIAVDDAGHAYVTGLLSDSSALSGFVTTPGAYQTTQLSSDAFILKLNPDGTGLIYSTLLGGNAGEDGRAIVIDTNGNAYVTGTTTSTNFPTLNPVQATFQSTPLPVEDGFVTKLNPDGSGLVYSTYLGGHGTDTPAGIALDSAGNAWIAGSTGSTNFPVTGDALQPTFGPGFGAAFTTKLDTDGALAYSSYLRCTNSVTIAIAYAIATDTNGNAYVTGTASTGFPTTPGAFQTGGITGGPFIAKIGEGNGDGGGETNVVCTLAPAVATNTVGQSHSVTATVTSNSAPAQGVTVAFLVVSGPNAGVDDSGPTDSNGEADFVYNGDGGPGIDLIRATGTIGGNAFTGTAIKVWVAAPANHDLAVLSIKAPKKVTLKEGTEPKPGKLQITIQNLGDHDENIADAAELQELVAVQIESLGPCDAPIATLTAPTIFPVVLAPGKKLKLSYTVAIDCANDTAATSKTEDHSDYRFTVLVDHFVLDGEADAHPANDDCPRAASGDDKGCGNKDPITKQIGADVLTDVQVK